MTGPVAYDITRLMLRAAVATPNGIDRIDLAFARHFLGSAASDRAPVFLAWPRPAMLPAGSIAAILTSLERRWMGKSAAPENARLAEVVAALQGSATGTRSNARRSLPDRIASRTKGSLRLLWAPLIAAGMLRSLPPGATFIHTTHYPFESLFRWLKRRPDIKAVFFVHDLLPLDYPEYFETQHAEWHRRSLEIVARLGDGAIVNTHAVERRLRAFLRHYGRAHLPILVAPMPVSRPFAQPPAPDEMLAAHPYFVMVGTIEPRKNHLMMLHVWRKLVRRHGARAPKLLIIGKRGWENENVVDLLERSTELRGHVIEAAGLETAAVIRLLASARALLAPSFAEGYGLPLIEALALGVPVIASDIDVFREVARDIQFVHPLDGRGWLAAVEQHMERSPVRPPSPAPEQAPDAERAYFAGIERFIEDIRSATSAASRPGRH